MKIEDTCYYTVQYYWPGPARLYQFVCYTILVGGHFPQKINDNFLPCFLYKSFFYVLDPHVRVQCTGNYTFLFLKQIKVVQKLSP